MHKIIIFKLMYVGRGWNSIGLRWRNTGWGE